MKQKRISLFILTIIMGLLLVACRNKGVTATINDVDVTRTTITMEFTIKDPKNKLNKNSIKSKVVYKEDVLKAEPEVSEVEDKENTFSVIATNLSINHNYTLKVTALVNKKPVTLIDYDFKTKFEGSSSENPVYIETEEEFLNLEDDYNAYYKLVNDLDFSDVEDFKPLFLSRAFSGVFDGDGHTLKNIKIDKRQTYTAIFGRNTGTIKNLNIDNVTIELKGTGQSSQYIGILTGRNSGFIDNVNVTNSKIRTNFSHSGLVRIAGLAAYSESGSEINNSSVDVIFDITSLSRTEYNMGAIAGQLNGGKIKGNTSKLTVDLYNTTTAYIGGAVGLMDASTLYNPTANESEAELLINIETIIERVIANDRTVAISIGGFVGKAVSAKIKDAYAKARITYPKAHNTASIQSFRDKIAIGGFAGSVSNRSELENILSNANINLGSRYDEDIRLVAKVKFELGYNEDRLSLQEVKKGNTVEEPDAPTREGYNFLGWYLGNELYDFDRPVNNSINLVAQWEKVDSEAEEDKLVVIFDRGHSNTYLKEIKVKKGDVIELPDAPTRDGYKFLGWYIDDELYDFEEPIENSIAVRARWIQIGFDRIELIYVGAIVGESFNSTHIKNYSLNADLTLYTDEGKYLLSLTVGNDYELGDYGGGIMVVNDKPYTNRHYHLEDGEEVITEVEETSLDDYFDSEYILGILSK